MTEFSFGVVGTGFIADAVAQAMRRGETTRVGAIASRALERAQAFAADYPGATAVEGTAALVSREDIDAVYVATPTVAKEAIALEAISAGKHVLVDKPFDSAASVARMAAAARAAGVLFMDATHFVHHPRTAAIRDATASMIGTPRSLHGAFYFPFDDTTNIRFDPAQEPTGALGDLGWYPLRAIYEFLRPEGELVAAHASLERNRTTHAAVRLSGLLRFASGESSTFDIGYTSGTIIMDMALIGTHGMIVLDDFVQDWNNSFAFKHPEVPAGYTWRTGLAPRSGFEFVPTPAKVPHEEAMVVEFARLAASPTASQARAHAEASEKTQAWIDAVWTNCGRS